MEVLNSFLVTDFLRNKREIFSVNEFIAYIKKNGFHISKEEAFSMLYESPIVFKLSDGNFITRAGVFTNVKFSFKPTKYEVEKKCFFLGHRCIPFIDSAFSLPSDIIVLQNDKELKKVTKEVDSSFALELYSFYENPSYFLSMDCAACGQKVDYADLPPKLKLGAFEVPELKAGDRILCKVVNWDLNVIDIKVIHSSSEMQVQFNDINREQWFKNFENCFLDLFETVGPCSSIEEQLSFVYARNIAVLNMDVCGSAEELLLKSKKIALQEFGVEYRFWKKDQEVPAVGQWKSGVVNDFISFLNYFIDESILDCFLYDFIAFKESDYEELFEKLFYGHVNISEKHKVSMLLNLKSRRDILIKNYNRFFDYNLKDTRRALLELYKKMCDVKGKIDYYKVDLSKCPQPPLIIISQIFDRLLRSIKLFNESPEVALDSLDDIKMSIEGMDYNLDCAFDELKDNLKKQAKKTFMLI